MLFQSLFDELLNPPPSVDHPAPKVIAPIDEVAAPVPAVSTGSPSSTTVDKDAPLPSNSQTTPETQPPVIPNNVEEDNHDIEVVHMGNDPYFGLPILKIPSLSDSILTIVHIDHQISEHNSKWTKDHPLENIISELTRPVFTSGSKGKLDELGGYSKNKARWSLVDIDTKRYRFRRVIPLPVARDRGVYGIFLAICCHYEQCHLQMDVKTAVSLNEVQTDEDKEGKACRIITLSWLRPTENQLNAVKRSFRYLKGNRTSDLWYPKDSSFALTAFADADHAGCQDTRHSTSGSIQLLGDRLVSWSSKRQKSAAISSTEAEYIGIVRLLWLKYFDEITTYRLCFGFNKIPMNCDNKALCALCCNNGSNIPRSKHIDISFHFIKDIERIDILINKPGNAEYYAGYSESNSRMKLMNNSLTSNSDQKLLWMKHLEAPAERLKYGKCNLRLSSDVTSKEATLQVVYDVLKLTPFYKAFQVTADAPEIYMQEFWASAYVHNRSVRFKMNNKKHIIGLDQFRDILQICPKVGNKKFVEPPLEKEILIFLASLGHSGDIRKITDVNVNKLHQPWRSFAAIINKCLSGIPSYDSLRLSQAQILWGMYNKKNVDYAYLLWEDFIFKIENKNTKKGNAMYYPRFTKLVVNFVMEKDPSIPRRNKVNWHYARDDPMFTTINVISRNEVTQLYGAILPVALTNEDIRNSESYKEYYAMASGTIPPKTKGSKKKANTDTITKQKPPTAPTEKKSGKGKLKTTELETISEADLTEAEQLKIITKRSRQETHSSHASGSGADEGTGGTPGVPDAPDYDSEDDISWKSSDDDQDDEQAQDDQDDQDDDVNETNQDDEDDNELDNDEKVQNDDDEEQSESDDDDDSFDPTIHTPSRNSSSDDEDSDNKVEGTNVEGAKLDEEATYEEDQGNEAVEDTNTDLDGRDDVMTDVILPQVQATRNFKTPM
ncbi:hypothetical protein Tco_0687892 [Tanacetum coccineum]